MEERLQKLLSAAGVCSRRAAEAYIAAGRVTVNGIPASLSAPVVRTGNEYWFPVEFLQKYMSGITVTKGSDDDGVPMCKVMLSEYGGIPSLKNHSDYGTDGVSEPEYSHDDSGE